MTEARRPRSRTTRVLAGAVTLSLGVGATLLSTAAPAAAATPRAQAVGRFLDGAAGGQPIQSVVDLKDARATNPGTVSDQNPFDIVIGGQGDVPLSHKLQLPPSGNAFHVGAANQVAVARCAERVAVRAGAVGNQGGISAGGQGGNPASATLDLSAGAFPSTPLPLPGSGGAAALGGLTAAIGAVAARAHTPPGVGVPGDTRYNIGSLTLTLSSPALAGVLQQLGNKLVPPTPPSGVPTLPKACSFKSQALTTVTLAGGAVTIEPLHGSITVDLAALLRALGANLNALPANTDLLAFLLNYLGSAKGLSAGLQQALTQTFAAQKQNFIACGTAITNKFPLIGPLLQTLLNSLTSGQDKLQAAINGVIAQIGSAGGKHPFAPLVNGLKQALQIGVNVQPNGPHGSYQSPLQATPDQATPVVAGQTIVRAIEIDLGGGQGASLALANAAAGPSSRPAPPPAQPTSTPPSGAVKHDHRLPTGIPAGQGPIGGGSPQLPLVLLLIGLALAGAAGASGLVWKLRPHRH